jgi:glycine cleavage system H protein
MMKFSPTHEWIAIEGDTATVGITDYAQKELGDIVYVELPKIGQELRSGGEACVLESTKAAADVYAPASGTVIAVNDVLKTRVELLNQASESEGWLFKMVLKDPIELDRLLDREAYFSQLGLA